MCKGFSFFYITVFLSQHFCVTNVWFIGRKCEKGAFFPPCNLLTLVCVTFPFFESPVCVCVCILSANYTLVRFGARRGSKKRTLYQNSAQYILCVYAAIHSTSSKIFDLEGIVGAE